VRKMAGFKGSGRTSLHVGPRKAGLYLGLFVYYVDWYHPDWKYAQVPQKVAYDAILSDERLVNLLEGGHEVSVEPDVVVRRAAVADQRMKPKVYYFIGVGPKAWKGWQGSDGNSADQEARKDHEG